MDYYRQAGQALDEEAQRLWKLVQAIRETGLTHTLTSSIDELSSYDQHPADHGSETFEREKDLGLLLDTYEQLNQVEYAKQRLVEGTYGMCEACGWRIGWDRLEALPYARLCIDCKKNDEKEQNNFHRPVEEEVLSPPFGRTFDKKNPAIDGEDTWQAVARFGTANSPQDVPDSVEIDDAYVEADEDEGIVSQADAIIDLDYRQVSDQHEIYPELQENPARQPYAIDFHLPHRDMDGHELGWSDRQAIPSGMVPEGMDTELWEYIHRTFPGNPEMEMAQELGTSQLEELAQEFDEVMRKPDADFT